MESDRTDNKLTIEVNQSVLKTIFDKYAEDTVTDEQVKRILTPIIRMIFEGRFSGAIRRRTTWLPQIIVTVAAVLVFVVITTVSGRGVQSKTVLLPEVNVPLANISILNTLSGRVVTEDKALAGVEIQLVDSTTNEVVVTTITNSNGEYSFSGLDNGKYTITIDGYTVINDNSEVTINSQLVDFEIRVGKNS